MKAAVFGTRQDFEAITELFQVIRSGSIPDLHAYHFDDYDDMREVLPNKEYQLAIILENGAKGMEACIGTRKIRPDIPMFWFSDDPYFGPQSYRLDCTYFSTKPLSESRLSSAFELYMEHIVQGTFRSQAGIVCQKS